MQAKRLEFPSLYLLGSWKFKGEQHLRQSGLEYVIVRPGGLTNKPSENKTLQFGQGDKMPFHWVPREDIAEVCVKAFEYLLEDGKPRALTFEVVANEGKDKKFFFLRKRSSKHWSKAFKWFEPDS